MAWSAGILGLMAVLHSFLGEEDIVRPLLASDWDIGIPRPAADRLIRFAWHLPSIAWAAMAGALLGLPTLHCTAWACAATSLLIFVMLRGHLAWPLFLAAAVLIWEQSGAGSLYLLKWGALALGVGIAVLAAALHFYWALGGREGLALAVPATQDGRPAFSPGPWLCAAVGLLLLGFAGCMALPLWGESPNWSRWVLWLGLAFLVIRAIGDGRQVGFTKKDRSTAFSQWDDALFTPLVVGLGLGALASLALGSG